MEMITRDETSLLTTLEQLAPPDHLCSIYETSDERLAVAIPTGPRSRPTPATFTRSAIRRSSDSVEVWVRARES